MSNSSTQNPNVVAAAQPSRTPNPSSRQPAEIPVKDIMFTAVHFDRHDNDSFMHALGEPGEGGDLPNPASVSGRQRTVSGRSSALAYLQCAAIQQQHLQADMFQEGRRQGLSGHWSHQRPPRHCSCSDSISDPSLPHCPRGQLPLQANRWRHWRSQPCCGGRRGCTKGHACCVAATVFGLALFLGMGILAGEGLHSKAWQRSLHCAHDSGLCIAMKMLAQGPPPLSSQHTPTMHESQEQCCNSRCLACWVLRCVSASHVHQGHPLGGRRRRQQWRQRRRPTTQRQSLCHG
jgi:hypothetical protein